MSDILEPEVLGCFFDEGFSPALSAMHLRWSSGAFCDDRIWRLPTGLKIVGPAPQRFGITVRRVTVDEYDVYLLWDAEHLCWRSLSRSALMASSLLSFLRVIRTDLTYLLDQPVCAERPIQVRTAA